MENGSNNQRYKGKEPEQKKPGTPEFDLDDLDSEIIELVDIIDEEVTDSDEALVNQEEFADKQEYREDFLLADVDLEKAIDDELLLDPVIESLDDRIETTTDALFDSAVEEEVAFEQVVLRDTAAERVPSTDPEEFEQADDLLAELFTSHEMDISQLLEEAAEEKEEARTAEIIEGPATEEELPEDLFVHLDAESEALGDETAASAEAVFVEGELLEDILPEFETGAEEATDEGVVVGAEAVLVEGELPEDMVPEFEAGAEAAAEEHVVAGAEAVLVEGELPEELMPEFATEAKAVAEEAVAGEAETERETLAPGVAEELAELVGAHVEEVVTRVVEERLPSIVERIIAREFEKIKTIKE
jgi:hypothetical protein